MPIPPAPLAALLFALAGPLRAADAPVDPAGAPLPAAPFTAPSPGPAAGVRRITDGALTCEQLHAESLTLEAAIARHAAQAEGAQKEADALQDDFMRQAGTGRAMPGLSGLMGFIPGVGLVGGIAAQAAQSARMSALQDGTAKLTAAYQRVAQANEQLAFAQGRRDHLVGLFLARNCKPPVS